MIYFNGRDKLLRRGLERLPAELRGEFEVCGECKGKSHLRAEKGTVMTTIYPVGDSCKPCGGGGLLFRERYGINDSESRMVPADQWQSELIAALGAYKVRKPCAKKKATCTNCGCKT